MAQVPVSMQVVVYPRNKTVKPYPATIVGYAWITGLEVGGGPVMPPELPPIEQPPPVEDDGRIAIVLKPAPEEGGWGFAAKEGWYWSPGTGHAEPKRPR